MIILVTWKTNVEGIDVFTCILLMEFTAILELASLADLKIEMGIFATPLLTSCSVSKKNMKKYLKIWFQVKFSSWHGFQSLSISRLPADDLKMSIAHKDLVTFIILIT